MYLQGMIDREYTDICITVPPRFNQTRLRSKGVIVHQEKSAIYQLGIVEVETNYGNMVRTYNKERCICDIIKYRRNIEWEFSDFSVDKCFEQLLKMQKMIDKDGRIVGTIHRYLIVAKK